MLSRDFVKRKRLDDLLTSQWRREHLKNKLNEEMIKQAFEEGKRPVQIAEQYNLNYATVYAILRKEGWTKDHIAAKHRWIKTRINNANRDAQLSKFYKTGNYSLEEIGSRYGLTRERVRRIVNREEQMSKEKMDQHEGKNDEREAQQVHLRVFPVPVMLHERDEHTEAHHQ